MPKGAQRLRPTRKEHLGRPAFDKPRLDQHADRAWVQIPPGHGPQVLVRGSSCPKKEEEAAHFGDIIVWTHGQMSKCKAMVQEIMLITNIYIYMYIL